MTRRVLDRQPELRKGAFCCPHCDVYASQDWGTLTTLIRNAPHRVEEKQLPDGQSREMWSAATCRQCGKVSIWRESQMIFPLSRVGGPPHEAMPESVREIYEEARAVAAVSRRAGAGLARAALERVMKELDPQAPKKTSLEQRVDRLASKVPSHLTQLLDVVRYTGNGALHPDDEPGELVVLALDDEEGPALLELFLEAVNQLVDELITKPDRANSLFNKLPEGVLRRIDQRGQAET
ncbi:DUF4145 domain-containing protein [Saccharopolyspora sp. TS4A08]|uniref:DUF4145 domain-containing protein n=1 Tax=Saccharopolyspora ipomoeae TaxID=3042027 RepID=A0ABT6PPE4_9PSEU|nr:DUF4145 domain-containing protein [Saccharopolyspora sp. TS4A08]MDI2029855.1 DUF4145 domain-containing protein [Saccharopolyspora sp. TS4A08]